MFCTSEHLIDPSYSSHTDAQGKLESSHDNEDLDAVVDGSAQEVDERFSIVKPTDCKPSAPEEAFSHYNNKLKIQDFELLKVLGKGSFGKVMLVRRCDDKCPDGEEDTLYALKTLRKATLIARNQLAHTSTERLILREIYSPFLVHLMYAFQTADKLYMVLDYVGGGELFFWLRKEKRFSERRCRLYAAEIGLALDAMHKENIVYRDLKPENVLLNSVGHVKLTDFGLAKGEVYSADGERGTKTFCGTPEYLAPEIIENKGHGIAVDWWALGTLLYEMLLGLPPFYDTNIHKMYTKILHDPLRFPKAENRQISNDAKDALRRFLERKIPLRLGSDGIDEEMQNVRFFAEQDFEAVYNHEISPEFCPPCSVDAIDVSNFDEEFTKEAPLDSVVTNKMTTSMERKSAFHGFTYVTGMTPDSIKEIKGVNTGGGKGRGSRVVRDSKIRKAVSREEHKDAASPPTITTTLPTPPPPAHTTELDPPSVPEVAPLVPAGETPLQQAWPVTT